MNQIVCRAAGAAAEDRALFRSSTRFARRSSCRMSSSRWPARARGGGGVAQWFD